MESDGFIKVEYKSNRRRKRSKPKKINNAVGYETIHFDPLEAETDFETVLKKVEECKAEIRSSDFYLNFYEIFKKCVVTNSGKSEDGKRNVQNIVCYGLGSVSTSLAARYQLALLLLMKEFTGSSNPLLYDPIFSKLDWKILTRFHCRAIRKNEEGKRKIDGRTLFFMPHCGRPLYNSILWANWSPDGLNDVILIGNSFNNFVFSLPEKTLNKFSYLCRVKSAVTEYNVPNTFRFQDIFNNMSIHVFDLRVLRNFPKQNWKDHAEPFYHGDDEIILS
ncbi:SRR1-like protein [Centruroides sculpturatus]|uniref:SRR1-like protein n=1 Tax=Centruroides sculpturatus TaxID=218467 RepID=UPI000C6CE654|nr:SRR1-like protein [Centruroides sculpturatus]